MQTLIVKTDRRTQFLEVTAQGAESRVCGENLQGNLLLVRAAHDSGNCNQ